MPKIKNARLRRRREGTHNSKYEVVGKIGEPCVYCMRISDTTDHVPALLYAGIDVQHIVVPSCAECNDTLGHLPLHNISDRRSYLKQRYKVKYASLLKTPDWIDEELREISIEMAASIRLAMAMRDDLRRMLKSM